MASPSGKKRIDEAILQKFYDLSAKEIHAKVKKEWDLSSSTWKRFVAVRKPIGVETFNDLCGWLDLPWQEIVAPIPSDLNNFYGRTTELSQLEEWVTDEHCRLVILYGMDGIGKNALVRQLEKKVTRSFLRIEWETFSYGDSVETTLANLIELLDPQNSCSEGDLKDLDKLKELFWSQLEQHCLIVLEQEKDGRTGNYDEHKKLLDELIRRPARKKSPSSCILLVTSFEKPTGLTSIDKVAVKCWPLAGVDENTGLDILKNNDPQLIENKEAAKKLIARFSKYPRALQLIGSHICNHHNGNVQEFLELDKTYMPDPIKNIIRKLIDNLDEPKPQLGKSARAILDILKDSDAIPQARLRAAYTQQMPNNLDFTEATDLLLNRSILVKSKGYAEYGKTYFFGLEEVTKQVVCSYVHENT